RLIWRTGSASIVSSDGAWLSIGAGRNRSSAARFGLIHFDAGRWFSDVKSRSAKASRYWIGVGSFHLVGSWCYQSPGRILGYFLAPVFSGHGDGPGVCTANDGDHEHDPS